MQDYYVVRPKYRGTKRMDDWHTIWHFPNGLAATEWDAKFYYQLSTKTWCQRPKDQVEITSFGRFDDCFRNGAFLISEKTFHIWVAKHFVELL